MKLFDREFSRDELLSYVGDISQLGGIESGELTEGAARGVRSVAIRTAEGLAYTINPDCGMNISSCSYKGLSICWRTGTGNSHPGLYDPQLTGWLRSFNGGLLVTCGLSQIGNPCIDDGVAYGLHGRISNTPAEVNAVKGEWVDDRYRMVFEGTVRESMALGPRLVLRRRVTSWLDTSEILVEDEIANESWYEAPLLTSYHINFGFPFITESAEVDFGDRAVAACYNDASRTRGLGDINGCDKPTKDFAEQIYLQDIPAKDGYRRFEVKNNIGGHKTRVRIAYSEALNNLIHWRQFGQGDYVLGFEPANTTIHGREIERASGNVVLLAPQQKVRYSLRFAFDEFQ